MNFGARIIGDTILLNKNGCKEPDHVEVQKLTDQYDIEQLEHKVEIDAISLKRKQERLEGLRRYRDREHKEE